VAAGGSGTRGREETAAALGQNGAGGDGTGRSGGDPEEERAGGRRSHRHGRVSSLVLCACLSAARGFREERGVVFRIRGEGTGLRIGSSSPVSAPRELLDWPTGGWLIGSGSWILERLPSGIRLRISPLPEFGSHRSQCQLYLEIVPLTAYFSDSR
jgi:hypothetical protein